MSYPTSVKANGKIYKLNTDFRIAIECNRISQDTSITDLEKTLAIIYLLYGDEGLNDAENYNELLRLGVKFLCCGNEPNKEQKEPDMDYIQDEKYIKSSFKYDYQYDPYKLDYLHWWEFFNDLNNLSNSEFGDCCILNRVRNLRTYDTSQIKDSKERAKIEKAKKEVALKKNVKKDYTDEEVKNNQEFYRLVERR